MKHKSKIGTLSYRPDEESWVTSIKTDAFKQYRFRWDRRNHGYTSIDVWFRNFSETDTPDSKSIAVASKIIGNAATISSKLGAAAWEFLQSKHGEDIVDVAEFAYKPRKPPRISSVNDIGLLIGCPDLEIDELDGVHFGRFSFSCGWDIEHGLGICTNGTKVTGIGDSIDVCPGDNCG